MESLQHLVERAELEAKLALDDASQFLERERLGRRARLDEALRALEASRHRLAEGSLELEKAARGELQTQARFELSAHSLQARRPPLRALSITQGTAICAFLLGFSVAGGGVCLTGPFAVLVALLGRDDA